MTFLKESGGISWDDHHSHVKPVQYAIHLYSTMFRRNHFIQHNRISYGEVVIQKYRGVEA
jgi:hypothetical protein